MDEVRPDGQEPRPEASSLPVFEPHALRGMVLGEVHARPFRPARAPRVYLRYGFMTDEAAAAADRDWLSGFCKAQGAAGPEPSARYHVVDLQTGSLRWERHGEFTTYTWDGPGDGPGRARGDDGALEPDTQAEDAASDGSASFFAPPHGHPFGASFRAPGPLIVAVRLDLLQPSVNGFERVLRQFDRASLAVSEVEGDAALIATDFRQDRDGLTRIVIANERLHPQPAGALAQRLLELETYRTLSLLGLAEANRQAPTVVRIEDGLFHITEKMRSSEGVETNRVLLDDLTQLAAELESGAAASAYRFGATRAYDAIVGQRLIAIDEKPAEGYFTFGQFLNRRMAPAMRTCRTIEERQANLSRKLARAATLLRTRVDVELERQNRDLLMAMNRRARLQLRLQQTVEGLSVAAISYYVVGLAGYLAKAAKEAGLPVPRPEIVTGLSVPVAVVTIWYVVRRIRAHHNDADEKG
ncbi:DUF3422 domain-containing protein [Stappia sp. F7233]|uniref:DUF3422 domain-containing protein n=1 Tax=Stappia albiluteola TaxID=2758565 RepID=A0A839AHQ7_9HYPH|nr:DUF3422 domain-containing protein [Stappia albiluteola]MBA5779243.1 DUF3422 domain-containing protein [Stappia albiluteola]